MIKCEELKKLDELLTEAGIPHEVTSIDYLGEDGVDCQICYPSYKEKICDAINHRFSYGHEAGKLEIMGLVDPDVVGDSVEGYLTAEQVFNRIQRDWEFRKDLKK